MSHPDFSVPARDLRSYDDPDAAVERLNEIYSASTGELTDRFQDYVRGRFDGFARAHYPYVIMRVEREAERSDPRVSFGFAPTRGQFGTTVTRPDLFRQYFRDQFASLLRHHGGTVEIGISEQPIPIHFAFRDDMALYTGEMPREKIYGIRDHFDVPDLAYMDDSIVNGTYHVGPDAVRPLALFTAPRVDYSLHRLKHYTGTRPEHFQSFVLFTNYQFYVEEFVKLARELMSRGTTAEEVAARQDYVAFVEPGDVVTPNENIDPGKAPLAGGRRPDRMPQMPAYHLKRADGMGITMVNIGVGPSNAKTITDHIAVLRPHCWLMLGHCAGLRTTQRLGDYVLAHAYVREDHVLDADLPVWVPVPPIAEVQVALERAVAQVTGFTGYELKMVMRTGTVATIDDRNWELRDYREPIQRFSQSRAVALDMESATIAANGFRFRVPYGTLLCVSDKPLHGEIKLPGMADAFYRARVNQHLHIGIKTMDLLRESGPEKVHSRKLRTFQEPAFR